MKFLKIFFASLLCTITIAKAQFTTAELQVSGLTCALCSKATEKSLKTLPFIGDIKPDLVHNVFVITFKNGQPVSFDLISKKVQDAGFFVNSLKATFNFSKVDIKDNRFIYGTDNFEIINGAGKPLSGALALTLIDKGFGSKALTKKYLAQAPTGATGAHGRVYHVVL